jgi:hypothetical protein
MREVSLSVDLFEAAEADGREPTDTVSYGRSDGAQTIKNPIKSPRASQDGKASQRWPTRGTEATRQWARSSRGILLTPDGGIVVVNEQGEVTGYDSSAASMPASSSGESAGASSSTGLDDIAARRQLAEFWRNVLAVPGHDSGATGRT